MPNQCTQPQSVQGPFPASIAQRLHRTCLRQSTQTEAFFLFTMFCMRSALDISLGSCSVSGCLTPFGIYTLFGMSHLLPAGVTLTTSSIRRRPNAFNLLHQLEAMQRGGFDNALQNLEALSCLLFLVCSFFLVCPCLPKCPPRL